MAWRAITYYFIFDSDRRLLSWQRVVSAPFTVPDPGDAPDR
jgi:hypothetical protein